MRLPDEHSQILRPWFRAFSKMRFPKVPHGEEEAASLRGDLISYDAYVAGYLSRLIDGQEVEAARLSLNEELQRRFEEFGARRPELWPFVFGCVEYLDTIHGFVRSVKQKAPGPES